MERSQGARYPTQTSYGERLFGDTSYEGFSEREDYGQQICGEGIRALTIDKDNAPKWNPLSLDNVGDEKVDLVFQPFAEDLELEIKEGEANRWDGKYENSAYASFKVTE